MASKELETYAREKQEESRQIHEGEAHRPADEPRKTKQALDAVRASLHPEKHDVPPDAEGQAEAGRIEQTTTSDGYTQSR